MFVEAVVRLAKVHQKGLVAVPHMDFAVAEEGPRMGTAVEAEELHMGSEEEEPRKDRVVVEAAHRRGLVVVVEPRELRTVVGT